MRHREGKSRRAPGHERLLAWLRLYVMTALASTMMVYGFAKVFESQFRVPTGAQLALTYGESTPMTLLWTFMGASRPYAIAAGLLEVVGGLLLLWRRTAAAGALVLLGVMGNVVLLNFCYDVPVKLYSTQLWLESLFVAWPALPALFAALVGGGPFARRRDPPLFASARARRIAAALHVALAAWLVGGPLHEEWSRHLRREPPPAMRAIRNAFEVDEMVVDGRAIPPGERSPLRWKLVSFGRRGMRVVRGDRRVEVYRTTEETTSPVKLDVRLLGEEDGASRGVLQLVPDPTGFVLEGTFEGRRVRAHLTLIDTSDSPLMTRGFHWINEVPFNR